MDSSDEPAWMGPSGYVAYVFFCFFGVGLFVHGLAVSCAGFTSAKSALSQSAYTGMAVSVVVLQFYTVGFTLECAQSLHPWIGRFVGSLRHALLLGVDVTDLPTMGYLLLRFGFALVPCCVLASAACQRGRLAPLLVFLFLWMSCVYCPVARWCWQPSGWSYQLGVLDYAGGTNIHVTAGFGALVYSYVLGPRAAYLEHADDPPFSLPMVVQGTSLMALGWIGFTGGSQIREPAEALLSVLNTGLSAAAGGFSWMLLDYYTDRFAGEAAKFSIVSFCSGVVSGLVAITPGAGYVSPHASPLFGVLGAIVCNYSTQLKFSIGVDDPLDIFAVHGIGGLVGTLLTGIFATVHHRRRWQVLLQLVSVGAVALYTLAATLAIALLLNRIHPLRLRLSPEEEPFGVDLVESGESAAPGIPDSNWYPQQDLGRLRNSNVALAADDLPLLQQLPLSYGLYTHQDRE